MLRPSKRSKLKAVKELDAFPKVSESYTESTASGGTVSIFSYLLIIALLYSEIKFYTTSTFQYKYSVDTDFNSTVKINIDITVAMPCETIGADVLDTTNQNAYTFGTLEEEPAYFVLSPFQRAHWDTIQMFNTHIREQYHAVKDILWREGYMHFHANLPKREIAPIGPPDACRLYGSLEVNKVAGNFHIIAGKHIPIPLGHAHISAFLREKDYNFSHRIERFSFGDVAAGIVDPLTGDEKIASANRHLFQYYLQIVPTEVIRRNGEVSTYQYSVTERERVIDHDSGSHGTAGIYFKYEISPIKVKVTEARQPLWQFLIRLCGIVGGIHATSGIINIVLKIILEFLCCTYANRLFSQSNVNPPDTKKPIVSSIITNDLYGSQAIIKEAANSLHQGSGDPCDFVSSTNIQQTHIGGIPENRPSTM